MSSDLGTDIAKSLLKGCFWITIVSAILATGVIYLLKWLYYEFF